MTEEPFMGHYVEWREKRLKAITDFYGASFFKGKTLLELGCGRAYIGKFFSDLGSIVTVCDGRKEHLDFVKKTYPELSVMEADLDKVFPFEKFDVVVNMGLLYHLANASTNLEKTCSAGHWLIIETEVVDSLDPLKNLILKDNSENYDQSMNRIGTRLSIGAIENIFKKYNINFHRINDDRCNSGPHKYDWIPKNKMGWSSGQRKMWFCEKG